MPLQQRAYNIVFTILAEARDYIPVCQGDDVDESA
jgi:hypothetical protein